MQSVCVKNKQVLNDDNNVMTLGIYAALHVSSQKQSIV